MPLIVCLHSNIHDENGEKHLRGDAFDASQEFIDLIVSRDAEAERPARITVIEQKKPGRPKKVATDED